MYTYIHIHIYIYIYIQYLCLDLYIQLYLLMHLQRLQCPHIFRHGLLVGCSVVVRCVGHFGSLSKEEPGTCENSVELQESAHVFCALLCNHTQFSHQPQHAGKDANRTGPVCRSCLPVWESHIHGVRWPGRLEDPEPWRLRDLPARTEG